MNEPRELLSIIASYIREEGAEALAEDIEKGTANLADACERRPDLADALNKLADRYTVGWKAVYF